MVPEGHPEDSMEQRGGGPVTLLELLLGPATFEEPELARTSDLLSFPTSRPLPTALLALTPRRADEVQQRTDPLTTHTTPHVLRIGLFEAMLFLIFGIVGTCAIVSVLVWFFAGDPIEQVEHAAVDHKVLTGDEIYWEEGATPLRAKKDEICWEDGPTSLRWGKKNTEKDLEDADFSGRGEELLESLTTTTSDGERCAGPPVSSADGGRGPTASGSESSSSGWRGEDEEVVGSSMSTCADSVVEQNEDHLVGGWTKRGPKEDKPA